MRVNIPIILALPMALSAALLSIQSFATNHRHTTNHQHQPIQFKPVENDGLTLSNFRARASIGRTQNSGAYGEILSTTSDRLVSASSSVTNAVELHEHINDNGVVRMREVEDGFLIRPNQSMVMKPGGYHIMLIGLHERLKANTSIDLSLKFESGRAVDLLIPIVSIKKMHH